MNSMTNPLPVSLARFWRNEDGVAAIELAMILPVLLTLLLGIVDAGNLLLLDKKTLSAAQIAGDLVTRNRVITAAQISDAQIAARMALEPFDKSKLGVDIVSIQFTGTSNTPTILWRETTDNMTPNPDVLDLAEGLGVAGEGVVITTTHYHYDPVFIGGMIGSTDMQEISVTRGRRGPLVTKN